MSTFNQMGLPASLQKSLDIRNFTTPTPIQTQTIPLALAGKDILGSAQTGTGKTLAFAIPLLAHLMKSPKATALVLAPTRELAQQVFLAIRQLVHTKDEIEMALLIGGEPMPIQLRQLQKRARVIVGTPGRVIDHLSRGTFKADQVEFLVLDEVDRMLDMGFLDQLNEIVKYLTKNRQTLLFSATLAPEIEKIAQTYLNNPERVAVDSVSSASKQITQETIRLSSERKWDELQEQLNKRTGSILVFVNTKIMAEKLADRLYESGHKAIALHGNLRQRKRDSVVKLFRSGKFRILIATDVAARGLDIPQLQHVINYDLPQAAEDYIHRIGRTGRAGAEGSALSFITEKDGRKWNDIERLMDPSIKKIAFAGGKSNMSSNRRRPSEKPWFKDRSSGEGSSYPKREGGSSYPRRDGGSSSYPKREGGSSYPRRDGGSSYGKREGGTSSYSKPEGSPYGSKREGGSSYSRPEGSSSPYPRREGGSSYGKREGGTSSYSKPEGSSYGKREGGSSYSKPEGSFSSYNSNNNSSGKERSSFGGNGERSNDRPFNGNSTGGSRPFNKNKKRAPYSRPTSGK